jgi:hypothetical protein
VKKDIMTKAVRACIAFLISLSFAHAAWIGEFPGLSKLISEADAIIILRVDKSDGDFGGMDLYSTHDCYVYQTLKGDIPTKKVIRLKLMDARSSTASLFAHHSTILAFLTKKRAPNESTDYRSLEIKGATIQLPPTGQEAAPKGDTVVEKIRWVLQLAAEFNAKEHEKEKMFLQEIIQDEAKP